MVITISGERDFVKENAVVKIATELERAGWNPAAKRYDFNLR